MAQMDIISTSSRHQKKSVGRTVTLKAGCGVGLFQLIRKSIAIYLAAKLVPTPSLEDRVAENLALSMYT